jgi:hypothetical protein
MVRREGSTGVDRRGGQDTRREHSGQNSAPKLPTGGTLRPPVEKKSTFVSSTSNQHTADQPADDKKGANNKEVLVDLDDTDKKLRLSKELDAK